MKLDAAQAVSTCLVVGTVVAILTHMQLGGHHFWVVTAEAVVECKAGLVLVWVIVQPSTLHRCTACHQYSDMVEGNAIIVLCLPSCPHCMGC